MAPSALPTTYLFAALRCLALCLWAGIVTAQTPGSTLTGRVIDTKTGQPLPFASVYINNSSRGTTANENGLYRLANVPPGTHELVGSALGYQTARHPLRLTDAAPRTVDLKLEPTGQNLEAVTVTARRSNSWQRQLRQFSRELLGRQPQAQLCQLMNPNVLSFEEEKGRLRAKATEPLVIDNQALGYRLHFDLLHFDVYRGRMNFAGTSRFEELTPVDARQQVRWQANRQRAYQGSLKHLLTTLLAGTHERAGYTVYQTPLALTTDVMGLPLVRTTDRQRIDPAQARALFRPGTLPFERRLVTDHPLEVYYNRVYAGNSPYRDSPYAYSMLLLPNKVLDLTINGGITQGNGLDVRGFLGDDRLATLLPVDWVPAGEENLTALDVDAGKPLRPDAGIESLVARHRHQQQRTAPLVFVHSDKGHYCTGDQLWLSAFVLDATRQLPIAGRTGTLQIELIGPDGRQAAHQWLRLTDGRAASVFRLADTLSAGLYRLRAYTELDQPANGPAFERRFSVVNLRQFNPSLTGGQAGQTNAASVILEQTGATQPVVSPTSGSDNWHLTAEATPDRSRLTVRVQAPGAGSDQPVYVTLQSREQLVYQQKWSLQKGVAQFSLPTTSLPPGVCRLTLWDGTYLPRAERLVFIPEQDGGIRMAVSTSQPRYDARQQVSIGLRFRDADNNPVAGSWSASVTDADQLPADTLQPLIKPFLLLTAGLRGQIASPEDYLQSNRLADLDSLLVTQTWRRGPAPQLADTTGGWHLSGRVFDKRGRPATEGLVVVQLQQGGQQVLRNVPTDGQGRFRLGGLLVADTVRVTARALLPAGASLRFNPPGQPFASPTVTSAQATASNKAPDWVVDAQRRQSAWPAFYRDSTAHQLAEVVVRAAKPAPERPKDVERASLHGSADNVFIPEHPEQYADVASMFNQMPGMKQLTGRNLASFGDNSPLYLIDGIEADYATVFLNLGVGDISRVELLKNPATAGIYGVRGANGVIAIYTKKQSASRSLPTRTSTVMTVMGFTEARTFYVPSYEQPATAERIDRRDVLCWQPIGESGPDGLGRLTFPLNDTAKRLRIVVQGISNEGVPMSFAWELPVR